MILEIKSTLAYLAPLFADELFCLPEAESAEPLARMKQIKQFKKGAHLFEAGEIPVCIYRLITGDASLLLSSAEIRISRLIEPNEVLGLPEAISGTPYRFDAKTITPCSCEYLHRDDLIRLLHNKAEIASRLAILMGSNLQNSYKVFSSQ